jgi:hypothetical protein
MHDTTLNASSQEGFPTHNRIGDCTGEISRVFGDTCWVFLIGFTTFF